MHPSFDRRTIMMAAAGALAAAALPGAAGAKTAAPKTGELRETQPPLASMLPSTRYFEIDSERVGGRFGVWITTPPLYDREAGRRYPAIYQPDGNLAAPLCAPDLFLLRADPINPIEPFVLVCVGYVGKDAERQLAVRARDLLPPSEPLPAGLEAGMDDLVKTGFLDREGADQYLYNLRNPAADKFLAFLTDELHPLIAANYRVTQEAGLFGYSYGGLFATYAALSRTSLFKWIGAGSPGILPRVSKVFDLYEKQLAAKADFSGRKLHMTVCAPELTHPSYYQPLVAEGTSQFIALAGQRPLQGLSFSSHIVPYESHATGTSPSWYSYLRTCFGAKA